MRFSYSKLYIHIWLRLKFVKIKDCFCFVLALINQQLALWQSFALDPTLFLELRRYSCTALSLRDVCLPLFDHELFLGVDTFQLTVKPIIKKCWPQDSHCSPLQKSMSGRFVVLDSRCLKGDWGELSGQRWQRYATTSAYYLNHPIRWKPGFIYTLVGIHLSLRHVPGFPNILICTY